MATKYISRHDKIVKPNTVSSKFKEPTCKLRSCKAKKGLNTDGFCKVHVRKSVNASELYSECKECTNEVKESQQGLCCDKCSMWFHIECIGVSLDQYKFIIDANKNDMSMFYWYCRFCRDRCVEAVAKIDLLEGQTRTLASNVATLNERVDKLETKISSSVVHNVRSELDERADIDRRKYNVVVFNVEESKVAGNKNVQNAWYTEKRKEADMEKFTGILSESMNVHFRSSTSEIKDAIRLGAEKVGSARPLKVTFSNIDIKREVLSKSKLLNGGKHKNVYINPDLTPKQREIDTKLRAELKERRNSGEKDLQIKRGRIVKGYKDQSSRDNNPASRAPGEQLPRLNQA